MASLRFFIDRGKLYGSDGVRDFTVTDAQCEAFLDLFQEAGATRLFLDLYELHLRLGGIPRFMPREALRLSVSRELSPSTCGRPFGPDPNANADL